MMNNYRAYGTKRAAVLRTALFSTLAAVLAVLLLAATGTIALAADETVDITGYSSVPAVQTAIQTAISSQGGYGTVAVTGTYSGADSRLSLNIPAGVTVEWGAKYSGDIIEITDTITHPDGGGSSFKTYRLIMISGAGNFTVVSGGEISAAKADFYQSSALYAGDLNSFPDVVPTITILTGGKISVTGESYAYAIQTAGDVIVDGGKIFAECTADDYTYATAIENRRTGTVTVINNAEIDVLNGYGIDYATYTTDTAYGAVTIADSTINGTNAIRSRGDTTVTNSTLTATTGHAISCRGLDTSLILTDSTITGEYALSVSSNSTSEDAETLTVRIKNCSFISTNENSSVSIQLSGSPHSNNNGSFDLEIEDSEIIGGGISLSGLDAVVRISETKLDISG